MKKKAKVELKNFNDWNIYEGAAEGSGRSRKIWLQKDDKIGIFKFPKNFTVNGQETEETSTEFLAEKLATIIAEKINVKCAKVDIGTFNGKIGSMSYKITENLEILIEGIQLISSYMPNYNQDTLYDEKREEYYNLQMIENSIKSFINEIPEDFYKMLIFDFIIGNNDRHHSNWAFIMGLSKEASPRVYTKFSPLYDNGSSLCSYIKEADIFKYTKTKDELLVNSLVDSKSKSIIRINSKSKKLPTQVEFIKYLKKYRNDDIINFVNYLIKQLNSDNISEMIEMFSDNIMSMNRKELLNLYLNKKVNLLKKIFYGEEN